MSPLEKFDLVDHTFPDEVTLELSRTFYNVPDGASHIARLLESKPEIVDPFIVEAVLDEKTKDIDLFGDENTPRDTLIDISKLPHRFADIPNIILLREKSKSKSAKPQRLIVLIQDRDGTKSEQQEVDVRIFNKQRQSITRDFPEPSRPLATAIAKDTNDIAIITYNSEPLAAVRYVSPSVGDESTNGYPKVQIALFDNIFEPFPHTILVAEETQ
jgi:hypothetical protein